LNCYKNMKAVEKKGSILKTHPKIYKAAQSVKYSIPILVGASLAFKYPVLPAVSAGYLIADCYGNGTRQSDKPLKNKILQLGIPLIGVASIFISENLNLLFAFFVSFAITAFWGRHRHAHSSKTDTIV